ncbi:membrane protein, putative [Mycoplasma capricolum subsp. capricolum ATCC 27343]|uniref:Membrane protein, putative n=2 Tax=Mycoplasma capricolum TaxID=2095 RepID=Q2SSC2_MYCCT|nr:membrane protein [Mycoplasma capricolum]ABC01713.1 membrane protein, putative [Mycoplasma capricolum subsp. capricolum ATCC 27343]
MKKNKLLSKSYKIAILLLTATSGLSLTTLIKNVNQDNTVVRLYQDGSGNSGSTSGNGNNGTSNGNDNTTNSTDPLTPKISDQFDTFKEKAEKSIKETLEKVQKKATEIIEQELGKLKKLDEGTDKSEQYFKNLQKRVYLTELKKHFSNKDAFEKEASKYGFDITFPKVIANDKKVDTAIVKFNGKTYNNIKVSPDEAERDYTKVVEKDKQDGVEKNKKEQENVITSHRLDALLSNYSQSLLSKLKDIIYKEEQDLPEFGKDIFFSQKNLNESNTTTNESGNTTNIDGYTIVLKEEHKTWQDYIKTKIKNRFVDFDLNQNQAFQFNTQSSNSSKPTPPNIPDINKKPLDPTEKRDQNSVEYAEQLPRLQPILKWQYADKDQGYIKSTFKPENEEKEPIFFFINPVNTRFKYHVTSLDDSGRATVKIKDQVKDVERTYYTSELTYNADPRFTFILENLSKKIEAKFLQLYKALLLDEKINYVELNNDHLQTSLFGLVNLATRIVSDTKYLHNVLYNIATNKYQSLNDISSDDDYASWINKVSNQAFSRLLHAISASQLNNQNNPWTVLTGGFKSVQEIYQELARVSGTREAIIKKANEFNIDLKHLDQLYDYLDTSILKAQTSANQIGKALNILSWYDDFTNHIKDTSEHSALLKILTDTSEIKNNEEKVKELQESYQSAIKKLEDNNRENKRPLIIISSLFIALSLLFIIANTLVFLIKAKRSNNKNAKLTFIISTTISTIITISSIILLIIGLKG